MLDIEPFDRYLSKITIADYQIVIKQLLIFNGLENASWVKGRKYKNEEVNYRKVFAICHI